MWPGETSVDRLVEGDITHHNRQRIDIINSPLQIIQPVPNGLALDEGLGHMGHFRGCSDPCSQRVGLIIRFKSGLSCTVRVAQRCLVRNR
jgi:hypothetical protein